MVPAYELIYLSEWQYHDESTLRAAKISVALVDSDSQEVVGGGGNGGGSGGVEGYSGTGYKEYERGGYELLGLEDKKKKNRIRDRREMLWW
ncbi:hypothetical protein M0802_005791 [Mischocyttarus mexicanus]|nr:hypothetical protein M0802_005791 [Mischocyttarus mexicanus]